MGRYTRAMGFFARCYTSCERYEKHGTPYIAPLVAVAIFSTLMKIVTLYLLLSWGYTKCTGCPPSTGPAPLSSLYRPFTLQQCRYVKWHLVMAKRDNAPTVFGPGRAGVAHRNGRKGIEKGRGKCPYKRESCTGGVDRGLVATSV